MVAIASTTHTVSTAAVIFLSVIVGITAFLVVFYMFFTKKACFKNCGGCDGLLEPGRYSGDEALAKSFDDSDSDSSDDSEEETMRQMRKTVRRSSARKNNGSSSDIIDDQQPSTSNIDTTLNTNPSTPSSGEKQMNEQQTVMDGTSPNEAPKQMESPASHVSTNDGKEWNIDDSESVYSRELSSSLMEEDEVAVAIAAKPSPLDGDSVDISMEDTTPISACGVIDIAVQYSISDRKLQITIIEAKELPSKDRGGASIIQVRAVMLPAKRKRYKTKVQHINSSRFAETFKVSQVSPEELRRLGLRVRLYGIGKVRDRLIGEATVRFDELNLIRDPQLTVTLQLEPRTDVNRGDQLDVTGSQGYIDTSSVATLAHGGSLPELLLSLSYNEMTGRLCVEVVKGSHFRNLAMSKPPDTFVKLVLLNSSCQEMAQSKTTIRRSQPNPVFKEPFYFQVALFQLVEVSLMVSVYSSKTIKKKEMLGWISLGQNSSSEADEQHWLEMKEAKGNTVSRWHTLIES
uniref:synaptotagmin-16-like isoform X2 n=1 Tax=Ciona intestinalis TaxID=7719 RepID=UPI00006A6E9A|nr:synaptotagmin-16-like isoform X2 [Ciona intestinalis]|eukprot:XP_004227012.1 synaptotagmin-16-like isoform X2 [Ciona intestinalis]